MSLIDPRTVILLSGVMSGLMSLVLYSLKRNHPASIKGLAEWSVALLVIFVGAALTAARGKLPDLVSVSASQLLVSAGTYLLYLGTQRFYKVTPRVGSWMSLVLGVLLAQVWFTFVEPNQHVRLVLSSALMAALFGVHARLVFRSHSNGFSRRLTLAVLLCASLIQIMRLVTSGALPLGPDIFDTAPHHLFYITSFSFSVLLLSISLVLMATDRLRFELEYLATHDSLTNVLTRRYINEASLQELERCRRHGRSMALMLMDLDHFKAINDTYGHQAGDQVLIDFVTKVSALLRGPDKLGRFGGEEFMVLLPETSLKEALSVAERIRDICERSSEHPAYTVSVGVSSNRSNSDTVESVLARADAAMYRAKESGRNRVEAG